MITVTAQSHFHFTPSTKRKRLNALRPNSLAHFASLAVLDYLLAAEWWRKPRQQVTRIVEHG